MQAQPKVQNNSSENELSLDERFDETVVNTNSNGRQDEAELVAAEKIQAEKAIKGTQVISSPRGTLNTKKDKELYTIASIAAGVFVVVVIYAVLVFI